jgi:PPOX class probable F420-dependent enzyme
MRLSPEVRRMIESGRLAHLVTLNRDGSPQVSCVWVGIENDEIVSAHLSDRQQKLRNVRRDPRVSLSIEGTEIQPPGLLQYLVVHGRAASPRAAGPSSCSSSRTATSAPT